MKERVYKVIESHPGGVRMRTLVQELQIEPTNLIPILSMLEQEKQIVCEERKDYRYLERYNNWRVRA